MATLTRTPPSSGRAARRLPRRPRGRCRRGRGGPRPGSAGAGQPARGGLVAEQLDGDAPRLPPLGGDDGGEQRDDGRAHRGGEVRGAGVAHDDGLRAGEHGGQPGEVGRATEVGAASGGDLRREARSPGPPVTSDTVTGLLQRGAEARRPRTVTAAWPGRSRRGAARRTGRCPPAPDTSGRGRRTARPPSSPSGRGKPAAAARSSIRSTSCIPVSGTRCRTSSSEPG